MNQPHTIGLVLTPEPWTRDAACATTDPDLFFPAPGDAEAAAKAKTICRTCDSRDACLEYALRNNETDGIYGGESPTQRARMRRGAA